MTKQTIPRAERLIAALDVAGVEEAKTLVQRLGDSVSFYKVGLELFMADGFFGLIDWLTKKGNRVFVDLKFFDIPETVAAAVRGLRNRGVTFATVHGNQAMLEAAGEAKGEVKILAVTVLTSLDQIIQIALVQAGQHGNGKNLHFPFRLACCFEHRLIAVYGGKSHASVAETSHRGSDGLGDIEELQVDEDLVSPFPQPIDELEHPTGHEQLQPDLVETHAVSQALYQGLPLLGVRDVQSRDQPLLPGNALRGCRTQAVSPSSRRPRGRFRASSARVANCFMSLSRASPRPPLGDPLPSGTNSR